MARQSAETSIGAPPVVDLNRNRPLLGITLKVVSALIFTGMVTLVKITSDEVPIGEVMFARNFFGLIPVLIVVGWRGELVTAFATRRPMGHLSRAVVGGTAMALWFAALGYMPLPDATAISFSAPLMTVVLAAIILGETVRIYRWTAVVIGFLGILIILSPHLGKGGVDDAARLGAGLAFLSACFMALAQITVRRLTNTERTATIVIWFSGTTALLSLLTLPFGWVMPTLEQAVMLVTLGLLGGVGQILLTQSYRYADAATIAPFEYTAMLWAILVGWLVFEEAPVAEVIAGSAIVIGAGIFVIYRERRLGLDRSKSRRAVSPSKL